MGKYNTLGNRIKSRRQTLGLSQSELSKQLNCTQAALSQYESGNREPGLKDLSNIAKCLQTTTDYLLGLTDIASKETSIKMIGDYLGLTEESIDKLHRLLEPLKEKTKEQEIQNEVTLSSGVVPGLEGYEDKYNFFRAHAFIDLDDHYRIINEFICSDEFNVFISSLKRNLFLERTIYDILRVAAKQYQHVETPGLSTNIAETAYTLAEDSEDDIKSYSLNLFDAQNAVSDFCRNFTKLEEIKKIDYRESLYRKLHFFLYYSTRPMFENKSYSVEKMESELSEVVKPLLPTIEALLNKKN